MKSGNINQFASYSKFRNLKDFNHSIEQWMVDIKGKFTKGELIGLKRLIRYSAKIPGVCNAKVCTLVSACQEMGGISRRTFERMLTKAKHMGLLEIVHTFKEKSGRQGHNLYIFKRCKSGSNFSSSRNDVPVKVEVDAPLIESTNLSKTSKQLIINKRYDESLSTPLKFTQTAQNAFSKEQIVELWKAARQEAFKSGNKNNLEKDLRVAVHSLRILIQMMKRKQINNPIGYFKRTAHNIFKQLRVNPIDSLPERSTQHHQEKLPKWFKEQFGDTVRKRDEKLPKWMTNPPKDTEKNVNNAENAKATLELKAFIAGL